MKAPVWPDVLRHKDAKRRALQPIALGSELALHLQDSKKEGAQKLFNSAQPKIRRLFPIFVCSDSKIPFILSRRLPLLSRSTYMSVKSAHEVFETLEDPDPALLCRCRTGLYYRERRQ